MILERIKTMLQACEGGDAPFPPTVLFNETWLLRIVLDWFAHHGEDGDALVPAPQGEWFSEAWLPSAFLARDRGDPLAESRTHADGVIGHFTIGDHGVVDLALQPEGGQFVVIEAKLFGRLSAGVKNAPYFDQAARSVACMAEVLRRADRPAELMDDLAFCLVAPKLRVDDGAFVVELEPEAIRRKVRRRVEEYGGMRDAWFRDWFEPTLQQIDILCFNWEDLIDDISIHDVRAGQIIDSFYGKCLHLHRKGGRLRFSTAISGTAAPEAGHAALGPGDLLPRGSAR